MRAHFRVVVLILGCLLPGHLSAQPLTSFTFTTIDFPGSTLTRLFGISPAGEIVGVFENSNSSLGFLFSKGNFFPFDKFSAATPIGINARGEIVGGVFDSSSNLHGFLLSKGHYVSFDFPGSSETWANGISPAGEIVGGHVDTINGDIKEQGFLLSKGNYVSFDFPGANDTFPTGINATGEIVGWYRTNDGNFGFLFSKGKYISINFPDANWTMARGINPAGEIVGTYRDSNGRWHGFLVNFGK